MLAQFGFRHLIKNISRPASNTCIGHILLKTKSSANIKQIIIYSNKTDHYHTVQNVGNTLNNRNNDPNPLKLLKIDDIKLSMPIQNHN